MSVLAFIGCFIIVVVAVVAVIAFGIWGMDIIFDFITARPRLEKVLGWFFGTLMAIVVLFCFALMAAALCQCL